MKRKKKIRIQDKNRSKQSDPNKEIENPRGRKVEFVLPPVEGTEVCLAGEFNGWDPQSLPMVRDEDGAWNAEMELPPGRYEFKAFMDGAWKEDMPCKVMIAAASFRLILNLQRVPNPFGTPNLAFWIR